jgi:hypothetical protein
VLRREGPGVLSSGDWCPICDGQKGWDKLKSILRRRLPADTDDSYVSCLWCQRGNSAARLREILRRGLQ